MNNRFVRVLALTVALGAFAAAAGPANAASLRWKDKDGDAVGLGLADGTSNDPNFDITNVVIETVGDKLVWTAEIPKIAAGRPTLSTGYNFRFYFTHAANEYKFDVGENALGEQTMTLTNTGTPSVTLECKDCKGKIDREKKGVSVQAPLASLDAAFKKIEVAPVSGSEWTKLTAWAQRRVGSPTTGTGLVLVADKADAPEGAIIQF
jgi:hypothetical protein